VLFSILQFLGAPLSHGGAHMVVKVAFSLSPFCKADILDVAGLSLFQIGFASKSGVKTRLLWIEALDVLLPVKHRCLVAMYLSTLAQISKHVRRGLWQGGTYWMG
jgi:hypothetical protein